MKIKVTEQLVFSVILLLVLSWFVYTAIGYNSKARFVPLVIGIPTLALAIYHVQADWRAARQEEVRKSAEDKANVRKEWNSALWVVGCFVLIYLIGFEWGLPLYSFLYARVRGKESWLRSLLPAIAAYLVLWIFFITLLHIPLYRGALVVLLRG